MSPLLRPMTIAPQDGTRILVWHLVYHYQTPTSKILDELGIQNAERRRFYRLVGTDWYPTGQKWEEAWWDAEYMATRRTEKSFENYHGGWMPWCGSYPIKTSIIGHPLGWAPRPGEENGLEEQHRLDVQDYQRRLARRRADRGDQHTVTGDYIHQSGDVQSDDGDD